MARAEPPAAAPAGPVQAAVRLRRFIPEVVCLWEERVRAGAPAARAQDRPALVDNLPAFLEDLAVALETPQNDDACAVSGACREHAEERARLAEYTLEEVVCEYHILRMLLLELLEREGAVDFQSRAVLHASVDRGIREAAHWFTAAQQEALLAADQRKNEFLAVLAHEFRTPLSAISNALHVLEHAELLDQRSERQVVTALRQTRHLSRLVADVMDVSAWPTAPSACVRKR